jgi:long-chain fatty acid transport protein
LTETDFWVTISIDMVRALALFVLFWPACASATQFTYQDVLFGEKASGMGGAFTALADDASAAYYNPAGLAQIKKDNLSLSASVIDVQQETIHDFFQGQDLHLNSFSIFPSDLYSVAPTEYGTFALAIVVPESYAFSASESYPLEPSNLAFNATENVQTYMGGPAWGIRVTPKLSVGASIFAIYGTYSSNFYAVESVPSTGQVQDEVFSQTAGNELGFTGSVGALYELTKTFRLGAVFRPGAQPYHTEDDLNVAYSASGAGYDRAGTDQKGVHYYSRIPMSVTAGAAYLPTSVLTLTADASFYGSSSYTEPGGGVVTNNPVVNGNLGGEYRLTKTLPLRFGLYSNRSAAPTPVAGATSSAHIDQYGATLSGSYEKGSVSTTLGIKGDLGSGQASSADAVPQVVSVTTKELAVSLSGTFRF